jgi:hypothetical protein
MVACSGCGCDRTGAALSGAALSGAALSGAALSGDDASSGSSASGIADPSFPWPGPRYSQQVCVANLLPKESKECESEQKVVLWPVF